MNSNDYTSMLLKSVLFLFALLVGVFVAVLVYLILSIGMSLILPGFAARFPSREDAGLGMQIIYALAHLVLIVLATIQGFRDGRRVFTKSIVRLKIK